LTTKLPISIQICTYNEETDILRCLHSASIQNVEEIIVIDGGSRDQTEKMVKEFGNVKFIKSPIANLTKQRELGVTNSKSDYVAFVDADDDLCEGWAKNLLAELLEENYSALGSRIRAVGRTHSNFFTSSWDTYFQVTIIPSKNCNMVGRPSIFNRNALESYYKKLTSNPDSMMEDVEMSIFFEELSLRQGISYRNVESFRIVPESLRENYAKFFSYGRGYALTIKQHPVRRVNILRHIFITQPIIRCLKALRLKKFKYPLFVIIQFSGIFAGFCYFNLIEKREYFLLSAHKKLK